MLTKRQKWTRHFWLNGVYFGSMGSTLTQGTGYEDAQLLGSGILLLGMILLKQT